MPVPHPLGEQPGDGGIEVDLAVVGGPDGGSDLFGLGILEDVARGAGLEGRGHLLLLDERGHGHDLGLGALGLDPADGGDAIHVRHQEVHQDDVGLQPTGHRHALRAVGRLTDDLDVGQVVEEHAQAHPDDRVVVDDEHADDRRVDRLDVCHGHGRV